MRYVTWSVWSELIPNVRKVGLNDDECNYFEIYKSCAMRPLYQLHIQWCRSIDNIKPWLKLFKKIVSVNNNQENAIEFGNCDCDMSWVLANTLIPSASRKRSIPNHKIIPIFEGIFVKLQFFLRLDFQNIWAILLLTLY